MSHDTNTGDRPGDDLWVAASAARHLTYDGVADGYRAAMAILHERAVWVRCNVVEAESVRQIVRAHPRPVQDADATR
jgi:hypothetical protein